MIDYITLFSDYNITYALAGKNIGRDFIGVNCPWCDDTSFHGGFPANGDTIYNCWRCGGHNHKYTLAKLLGVKNIDEIVDIYEEPSVKVEKRTFVPTDKVEVPGGPLEWYHKQYLIERRYDPEQLVQKYKVQGTAPYSTYGSRIYFPIMYKGDVVSYQGRSTVPTTYRYLAAKQEDEKIFHKHLLYNIDNCDDTVIVVEGIFDVLRLGDNSCATFGTSYTPQQLLLLKDFNRIFLLYDGDSNAQTKAKKATGMLSNIVKGEIHVVTLPQGQDPDSLSDEEARYLMRLLRRKVF